MLDSMNLLNTVQVHVMTAFLGNVAFSFWATMSLSFLPLIVTSGQPRFPTWTSVTTRAVESAALTSVWKTTCMVSYWHSVWIDSCKNIEIIYWWGISHFVSVKLHSWLLSSLLWNFCVSQFFLIFGFLWFLAEESVLCWLVLFFHRDLVNAKYPPNIKCISRSSHKISRKFAYLGVKLTSLDQKHKIAVKVANIGVSKLCIWFEDTKSSVKLPISL